ncbi:MAG: aminotransferase DegT [Planctomycetota bacterium]|nr:MAG: aminotransferase DegT [Planctomycetota bacterium]
MKESPPRTLPNDQDATGRTFGEEEQSAVLAALASGTLTSTKGSFVKQLEARFAEKLGVKHAFACTSGTAAIHVAVAALDLEPGDEVITTSITDMGALTPILAQGAIPVFADVDAHTLNLTAATIQAVVSVRTKAILVTHLFGDPCEMEAIMELADQAGIAVLEDCCQAFGAADQGHPVGSIGAIGCFSLQQGKHITTGEGGLVTTDDDALARRLFLMINKAWGYGDQNPDHYFLALNYRMNEITGAVALAQMQKLDHSVASRVANADQLSAALEGVNGISLPLGGSGRRHTYWRYCLDVDPHVIPGGTVALGNLLRARGIGCAPRYIQKPAFQCQIFTEQRTFGTSKWPFTLASADAVDYSPERFPGTFDALDRVLVLPWNERFTSDDVLFIAEAIRESIDELKA